MLMIKDNAKITDRINQSNKVVEDSGIEEPLKKIAFRTVLEYLLNAPEQVLKGNPNPSEEDTKRPEFSSDSLVNYIKQAKLKSHSDKILMMAYFMMTKEDTMTFNHAKIKEKYLDIREPESKNLSVEFNSLIKRGLIMNVKDKKTYSLTQQGITYVEGKLENGTKG